MDIIIRRVRAEDQAEWLRMRGALWPEATPEEHQAELAEIASDPLTPVFVAERPDGRLAGFLEGGTRPYADGCETRPVGYIEGWYVDEDVRRHGVGAALIRAMEAWVRAQGLKEVASDTWLDNETSLRAHLALGYAEAERLIHFVKKL
jgi:aminoglycoside 6'-N-acetyltransferase I